MSKSRSLLSVVGAGYVGLTTGLCMADLGHNVRILDIDEDKLSALTAGEVPFYEAGMSELLNKHLDRGTVAFSSDVSSSITGSEFVFLCVHSPAADDGSVDLTAVQSAATAVAPFLSADAIVVNKSTVPVGSTGSVREWINRDDVAVASNPEFLREGTAVQDFMNPDRIVIGASTLSTQQRIAALYESIEAPIVMTDPRSAELIKYVCNTYLASRLSFVNDVAQLCEISDCNIADVTAAMGLDPRIGPTFLKPGPGWGGSCLPKDSTALVSIAQAAGFDFPLLQEVVASNEAQLDRVAERASRIIADRTNPKVAVWGLAFKSGTDDTRMSPAISVVDRLVDRGMTVAGYDPKARYARAGFEQVGDAVEAVADADLLVVLTEWPQFAEIDPAAVAGAMGVPRVFDTRGILDLHAWAAAGFTCMATGVASPSM